MRTKILIAICIAMLFMWVNAFGAELDYSVVKFTNQSGEMLTSYPVVGEQLYAYTTVKNTGKTTKHASLVVAVYKDGVMKKAFSNSESLNSGESGNLRVPFTVTQANMDVVAYALTAFEGDYPLKSPAKMLGVSTALKSLTIDGQPLEEYSDGIDEYMVLSPKTTLDIKAEAADNATEIQIPDYTLPGIVTIKVIPAVGNERIIKITVLKEEKDLYMLNDLSYKIGDEVYKVKDFSPNKTVYNIQLPDNTYIVELLPEHFSSSTIDYSVSNLYDSNKVFEGGISYGSFYGTAPTALNVPRSSPNGIVPIKWGNAKAVITVGYGSKTKAYTINFTAKQPYLTSFNYVGGANDARKPTFVSGGGLANDNGSISFSDRAWAMSNISETFIGASYFAFPANNRTEGWWPTVNKGEYFNFTASESGTVYMVSNSQISNSEYAENGWEKISFTTPSAPGGDWRWSDKTYNDYNEDVFFMVLNQWVNDTARTSTRGLGETKESSWFNGGSYSMGNIMAKHFEAGQEVKVYHTGNAGSGAGPLVTLVIRWDVGVYPYMPPKPDPVPEIFDENLKMWVKYNNNTYKSILDKESTVWKDLSGHQNDISIRLGENIRWTDNGLLLSVGANGAADTAAVTSNIAQVLNSNSYSLVFKLGGITPQEGINCPVFSSDNNDFSLVKILGVNDVRFKIPGAIISSRQASADINQVINGVNVITVEKKDDGKTYVKWYINGILVSEKSFTTGSAVINSMFLGGSAPTEAGNVVYDEIAVYDRVLSEQEAAMQGNIGGDGQ